MNLTLSKRSCVECGNSAFAVERISVRGLTFGTIYSCLACGDRAFVPKLIRNGEIVANDMGREICVPWEEVEKHLGPYPGLDDIESAFAHLAALVPKEKICDVEESLCYMERALRKRDG